MTPVRAPFDQRESKHRVRRNTTAEGASELRSHIPRHHCPRQRLLGCRSKRHDRVEVRTRNRTEGENQGDEYGTGSKAVGEQRDRGVAGRQSLTHDARSHDRSDQQQTADELRNDGTHLRCTAADRSRLCLFFFR